MGDKKSFEIRMADFWTVLKRCWWLMLAVLLVVGLFTYVLMYATHESEYTATATLYVGETNSNTMNSSAITVANSLVKDINELIASNRIAEAVGNKTGSMLTSAQIKDRVQITNPDGTHILYLSVTTKSPEESLRFARAFAEATEEEVNDLFLIEGEDSGSKKLITVFDYGVLPAGESNPISTFKIMLIAIAAALVVYLVFFLLYVLDDKINSAEDVQKYLGASLLGEIPNRADAGRRKSKYGYYAAETTTPARPTSGTSAK